MLKLAAAVQDMIHGNPYLLFSLSHNILSLRKAARYLAPLIEVRTKKQVSEEAIAMALSRVQRKLHRSESEHKQILKHQNIAIRNQLVVAAFPRSAPIYHRLDLFAQEMRNAGRYVILTEGLGDITIIVERDCLAALKKQAKAEPLEIDETIASVQITFPPEQKHAPGVLVMFLQHIALQNVPIFGVTSTYNSISFYMHEDNVHITFDTLYRLFK